LNSGLCLDERSGALYCGRRSRSVFMLALYIILGFVAVLAVINFIEFGRVD
jgi:hypothetical protein